MKKIIPLLIILFAMLGTAAQRTDSLRLKQVQVRPVKIVPASMAIIVRKDVSRLQFQARQLADSMTLTRKEIDGMIASMKNDLNSMSEMGETESLRLQMAMDRVSKMFSTLSNMMKKMHDTQQAIIQNMK